MKPEFIEQSKTTLGKYGLTLVEVELSAHDIKNPERTEMVGFVKNGDEIVKCVGTNSIWLGDFLVGFEAALKYALPASAAIANTDSGCTQPGEPGNQKITEATEHITVFRNANGIPIGLIIAEDESPQPVYGAFVYNLSTGWKWLSESPDKDKVYHEAREHFYQHTHYCPACRCDVECEFSYTCGTPEHDEICLDCQGEEETPQAPQDSHLERQS
jgi:hypothetical protein